MTVKLICLDADDTLWHNMRHFHEATAAFQAVLKPFADAEVSQSALYECETRNLHIYGYGAKGFTLSMIETATELAGNAFSRSMVEQILDAGRRLHSHPVQLLADVDVTLEQLAELGKLVLVTKGDLLHQESKLAASGLGDLFAGVEIVSDKTANTFRSIFAKYRVAPEESVMAGDSMRSDVLPALEAGAFAAFIPQGDGWHHERADAPEAQERFAQLSELSELPQWIDGINRKG